MLLGNVSGKKRLNTGKSRNCCGMKLIFKAKLFTTNFKKFKLVSFAMKYFRSMTLLGIWTTHKIHENVMLMKASGFTLTWTCLVVYKNSTHLGWFVVLAGCFRGCCVRLTPSFLWGRAGRCCCCWLSWALCRFTFFSNLGLDFFCLSTLQK